MRNGYNFRAGAHTVFNEDKGEFGELPQLVYFRTDKTVLADEQPATITWEVSNATDVFLNDQPVANPGSKSFMSRDVLVIKLDAFNFYGDMDQEKMRIDIDRTPPIIRWFKIDKKFAIRGGPLTLTWLVEKAATITIDNGIGDVTGLDSKMAPLDQVGVFNMVAESYFGFRSYAAVGVTVFPVPLIKGILVPAPQFKLEGVTFSQPAFNLDISVMNGLVLNQPSFTELNDTAAKILLKPELVDSVLFPNNIFKILIQKQKEITHIVKSVWKKKIRKILKRKLREE